MDKKFVRVLADVACEWEGLDPTYRLFVNDELFAERTWSWIDSYLEENIQIQAPTGNYRLRWELVQPHLAQLTVTNMRVEYGSAQIENSILRIF